MQHIRCLAVAILIGLAAVMTAPHKAHADNNWPCEVIVCMSNPGGATQYAACVPPMEEFWQCLANPTCGFPGCNEGGVSANMTYLQDYVCPTGTQQTGPFGAGRASEGSTCIFRATQGNVYTFSPVYNPYNIAFNVAWAGGGQTMYLDTTNQTESATDPIPALSAAQIAYYDSQPRQSGHTGGGRG